MKDEINANSSSSAQESCTEDFCWVNNDKFPNKYKRYFLKYPLGLWKNIIFKPDYKSRQINDEGIYYQKAVNTILSKDVFKKCDFHKEENGAMDFKFNEVYKFGYSSLKKKGIKPDFFVYKIEKKNFFELLNLRHYMMILKNNNIPTNIKYISIIGEIKSSYTSSHSYNAQRYDYEKFIDSVNTFDSDEFLILMYIYDNSFYFFQKDLTGEPEDKYPIIYGYMPKLYYENCYHGYNEIIEQLKIKKEKVVLNDIKKLKKKKRRELIMENEKIMELLIASKKTQKLLCKLIILISFIFVLCLALILK